MQSLRIHVLNRMPQCLSTSFFFFAGRFISMLLMLLDLPPEPADIWFVSFLPSLPLFDPALSFLLWDTADMMESLSRSSSNISRPSSTYPEPSIMKTLLNITLHVSLNQPVLNQVTEENLVKSSEAPLQQQFLPYDYISKLHDCLSNMGYRYQLR